MKLMAVLLHNRADGSTTKESVVAAASQQENDNQSPVDCGLSTDD